MKISVIIPFYNVSSFVGRCTQSLMDQTIKDVEFIFVDDASPDNSRDIIESVVGRHPDRVVRVLTHEANKGLPAARNTGMAAATGEYIYHCDSDDWLEESMLEKMYVSAKKNDADMVYCDYFLSFQENERLLRNPDYRTGEELLKRGFMSGASKYNVWNKLVRRSLYYDNGIFFPEGHSMGEDMTIMMLASCAKSVARVPEGLYHYVRTNQGAMTQSFSQRQLDDIRFNADRVLNYLSGRLGPDEEKWKGLFKMNLKLPFLLSGDKTQYHLWKEWFPEANEYATANEELPFRTKLLQALASKNLFWAVAIYSWLVNNVYYGLRYR